MLACGHYLRGGTLPLPGPTANLETGFALRRLYLLFYPFPMRLTWPLMGRAAEMRLIDATLADPLVSGIVICGAAGVGKSRIAAEALDAAEARGHAVRRVVGTSLARELPLGALASWAGPTGKDGLQLVWSVVESLTAAPGVEPVVVGVDDVHLLDDLSLFVLHQSVQRQAVKLVLTLRDGEAVPHGLQELWKLGQFDWLDLQPLPPADTATLLSATLAGSLDPDTNTRLYQLTRGNALYLRHIVEREVADGRLQLQQGYWRWSGAPDMPHSLVELIESRFGDLPAAVGTVVDVLAVGEPVELSALRRITDPAAVEEADMRGLISLEQLPTGVEVRVAHPLYGEVRRKHAAPTRLRRLRGLVAAELAGADNRDDVRILVRRAALSLDSDLSPDGDLLVRAAQGAICLADLPLAGRLAEAATRVAAGPEAQFIRGHALSWLGDGPAAEQVLAEVAIDQLTEDEFARFTYLRASNMLWVLADPERASQIIDEASHLTTESARRCVEAVRAVHWFATDRPDASLAATSNVALEDLPAVVAAETAWVLTNIHGDAGRTAEAVMLAERGFRIVRSSDAPHMRFNIADAQIGALLLAGDIRGAVELAEDERGHAADLPGAAHYLGIALAGRAALGAGRLDAAREFLLHASTALSASGHAIGWGYRYRVSQTVALAMCGLIDDAGDVLASLDRLERPFRPLHHELSIARAWVAAGRGAVSGAVDILRSAADAAAANGRFAAEVVCLQTATQFGDRSCESRLCELAAIVEGPRAGIAARLATALGGRDPAELVAVASEFESMGDRIAAVDALAHAAVAYRHNDFRGSAMECTTRAEAIAAQCGNAQTPALCSVRTPLPLTGREREIVVLLSQGLSNRDIAALLVVSVRTVEGHIYKAMTKTGTNSRDELAALLKSQPSGSVD